MLKGNGLINLGSPKKQGDCGLNYSAKRTLEHSVVGSFVFAIDLTQTLIKHRVDWYQSKKGGRGQCVFGTRL